MFMWREGKKKMFSFPHELSANEIDENIHTERLIYYEMGKNPVYVRAWERRHVLDRQNKTQKKNHSSQDKCGIVFILIFDLLSISDSSISTTNDDEDNTTHNRKA